MYIIQQALTPKDMADIRSLATLNEAWDHITELFIGNVRIQSSKFDRMICGPREFLFKPHCLMKRKGWTQSREDETTTKFPPMMC
jgi:hypothetical protein